VEELIEETDCYKRVEDMLEVFVDLAAFPSPPSSNDPDDDWAQGILQLREDLDDALLACTLLLFLPLFSCLPSSNTFQLRSGDVSPICLPTPGMHLPSEPMTVYGWGANESTNPYGVLLDFLNS
jgi:hypothetical protein